MKRLTLLILVSLIGSLWGQAQEVAKQEPKKEPAASQVSLLEDNKRLQKELADAKLEREKLRAELAKWMELTDRALAKATELKAANDANWAAAEENAKIADQNAQAFYRLQEAVAARPDAKPTIPSNPYLIKKPRTVSSQVEDLREELRLRELHRENHRFWNSFDR